VVAEHTAVLVHDLPRGRLEPSPLEERPVVVPSEETRLLALRPSSGLEAGTRGLGARLRLAMLAEREGDAVENAGVEPREHVRLILLWIDTAREQRPPAMAHDPCVVAGH
jgi:hypothetical protein